MDMPPAWGATQGRRFNGRPAVSKTASGGSNPSAPANCPASRKVYDGSNEVGPEHERLRRRVETRDAARDLAEPQTGGRHNRRGDFFRVCVRGLFRGGG